MKKKKRTTAYLDQDIVKQIRHIIADREETNIHSMSEAINCGLNELLKKLTEEGKIKRP